MEWQFDHEQLRVYGMAVDFAHWSQGAAVGQARSHIRDQVRRAAESVVLNIAEGSGHPIGNARRNHYRMAKASAAECCACLDIIRPKAKEERQQQLRHIGGMLHKMAQR